MVRNMFVLNSTLFVSAFDDVNDAMGRVHWMLYPIEVQRLLSIVMLFIQQPIELKVFGSITCSRESFKKVSSIN